MLIEITGDGPWVLLWQRGDELPIPIGVATSLAETRQLAQGWRSLRAKTGRLQRTDRLSVAVAIHGDIPASGPLAALTTGYSNEEE